jgi:hypothetical protein
MKVGLKIFCHHAAFVMLFMLPAAFAAGQAEPRPASPSVTMAPVSIPRLTRGKPGKVELQFRISPRFHINSNRPSSKYLIPTTLKLDPPTDIVISKVSYPRGEDIAFPFAPDEKLNVYSGDFAVGVTVRPLRSVLPGSYKVRGQLRYQACDNRACFPPKTLPVEFVVSVSKPPPALPSVRPNRQSPHVHQ